MALQVLGTLAMIDEGETDWKVIVIDVNDPLAKDLHDIDDVKAKLPDVLEKTVTWFRDYKVPDGKPQNEFAFGGAFKDAKYARDVIDETHEAWKKLVSGDSEANGLSIARASL